MPEMGSGKALCVCNQQKPYMPVHTGATKNRIG